MFASDANLSDIPADLIEPHSGGQPSIGNSLTPNDWRALNQVSHYFTGFFKYEKLGLLMKFVLSGEAEPALKMIGAMPQLLFQKSSGYDLAVYHDGSKRTIYGSPFQALLGAGDTPLLKSTVVQAALMANSELALAQLNEQFPNEIDSLSIEEDFAELLTQINENAQNLYALSPSKKLISQTEQFKLKFQGSEISSGWHFDLRIILALLKQFESFAENWNHHQKLYFFDKVYGYLQSLVSSIDAQIIIAGLSKVVNDNDIIFLPRKMTRCGGNPYYHTGAHPSKGLGVDSNVCVEGDNSSGWITTNSMSASSSNCSKQIENLYSIKVGTIKQLKQQLQQQVQLNLSRAQTFTA